MKRIFLACMLCLSGQVFGAGDERAKAEKPEECEPSLAKKALRPEPRAFEAIDRGDLQGLTQVLREEGAEYSQRELDGILAMFFERSSYWNNSHDGIFKMLVARYGACLDGREYTSIPLIEAVKQFRLSAVLSLLTLGADPNVCDAHGLSPIHVILDALEHLSGEGSESLSLSAMLRLLLFSGADLGICGPDGRTARDKIHALANLCDGEHLLRIFDVYFGDVVRGEAAIEDLLDEDLLVLLGGIGSGAFLNVEKGLKLIEALKHGPSMESVYRALEFVVQNRMSGSFLLLLRYLDDQGFDFEHSSLMSLARNPAMARVLLCLGCPPNVEAGHDTPFWNTVLHLNPRQRDFGAGLALAWMLFRHGADLRFGLEQRILEEGIEGLDERVRPVVQRILDQYLAGVPSAIRETNAEIGGCMECDEAQDALSESRVLVVRRPQRSASI